MLSLDWALISTKMRLNRERFGLVAHCSAFSFRPFSARRTFLHARARVVGVLLHRYVYCSFIAVAIFLRGSSCF